MPKSALAALPDDEEDEAAPAQEFGPHVVRDALSALAGSLGSRATDQRSRRRTLEQRWIDDLRQYHGRYNTEVEQILRSDKTKSRVFTNITRNKTHAWESRLGDMLFPTDDKNWGIQPTPVPELSDAAERAVEEMKAIAEQATEASAQAAAGDQAAAAQVQQLEARGTAAQQQAAQIRAQMDEAKRRCSAMEDLIEDQLRETYYNIRCRSCLTDLVRVGTQVMKGPVVGERRRGRWQQAQPPAPMPGQPAAPAAPPQWQMKSSPDPRPEFTRVNPWLFFPEMSAATIDECEFTFELHPLTDKALRALAKREDFDREAIAELLKEKPKEAMPEWWPQLREIADGDQAGLEARFYVWEYHGPLEENEVRDLITAFGDQAWLDQFEEDPLSELNVIVWFCQGRVIKFGPHPQESGESLYSVTPFEKDDTMMFGYGVPFLLRNPQAVINGASRMMLNNAGLSSGPQLFINQKKVEPADGLWTITANKVWLMKDGVAQNEKAFDQFQIENRQADLQNIIQLWRQFADEETEMPLIATGEQAAHITTTAQGMSILMNSANVVFRRVVKNYDDCHTTPNIRRVYDWNMQHSSRDDVKGDMEVDARGSSALLIRELQSQNMLNLIAIASKDPELAPYIDKPGAFKVIAQTMSVRADDLFKTEEQVKQDQADAIKNAQPPLEVQVKQMELEGAMQIEEMRRETALITLAQEHNMTLDELSTKLQIEREKNQSKERVFAGEAALTNLEKSKGGGGSL